MTTDSSLAAAFIQASYYDANDLQGEVTRVVIHGTVSPTVRGGARSVASYFAGSSAAGSAHYVVDPGEIVQCVSERRIAYHAPPNAGSIGVELCDVVDGDPARWADNDHQAMLTLAGSLVADICRRNNLPTVRILVPDLLAGKWGICGHVDVSNAFHQSDHHDPGDRFPWNQFITLVGGTPTGGTDVPAPTDWIRHVPTPDGYWHLRADGNIARSPGSQWRPHAMLRSDGAIYAFPYTEAGVVYQDYADLPAKDRVVPAGAPAYITDLWLV